MKRVWLFFLCLIGLTTLSAAPKYVIIISYAEFGSDYNLNTRGKERASCLPYYFSEWLSLFYGPPVEIFGARQTKATKGGLRIIETGTPTSGLLAEPLHVGFSQESPETLANFVLTNPDYDGKTVLIVWDFASIPSLIRAFGYIAPLQPNPPAYDLTYVLTFPFVPPQPAIVLYQALLVGDAGFIPGPPGPPGPPPAPPPPAPPSTAYVPFTLVNNTGQPDSNVYITIKGFIPPAPNQSCYLSFSKGSDGIDQGIWQVVTLESKTISYKLSELSSTIKLPPLISGRIYFSIGYPMDLQVTLAATGVPTINDPDALKGPTSVQTADSNFYTLYDKIEFTVPFMPPTASKVTLNPTALDFFCLPLTITMTNPNLPVVGLSLPRSDVITDVHNTFMVRTVGNMAANTQWNRLVLPDPTTPSNYLRIAATGKAMTARSLTTPALQDTIFDPNYLNSLNYGNYNWMEEVWNTYYTAGGGNHFLSIDTSELGADNPDLAHPIYKGQVNGSGAFSFTNIGGTNTVPLGEPTNSIPFFAGSGGTFTADNKTVKSILVKDLTAGVMVGIVPLDLDGTGSNYLDKAYFAANKVSYYQNSANLPSPPVGVPFYDLYSRAMHEAGGQSPLTFNQIYTFAYDDVLSLDGTLDSGDSSNPEVTIQLESLGTSAIPNPYTSDLTSYNVTFNIAANNYITVPGYGTFEGGPSGKNYPNAVVATNGKLEGVTIRGSNGAAYETSLYIKYQLLRPAFPGSDGVFINAPVGTAVTIALPPG
jgi:hypothetical protein